MANGGNGTGRSNFNSMGCYNPGHERGRSYGSGDRSEATGSLDHASMVRPIVDQVEVE
jgi:hypothetical protein